MRSRNILALVLTIVSLALLWPGLTKPVLTITASITAMGNDARDLPADPEHRGSGAPAARFGKQFRGRADPAVQHPGPDHQGRRCSASIARAPADSRRAAGSTASCGRSANGRWPTCSRWASSSPSSPPRAPTISTPWRESGSTVSPAYCLVSNLAFQMLPPPEAAERPESSGARNQIIRGNASLIRYISHKTLSSLNLCVAVLERDGHFVFQPILDWRVGISVVSS